MQNPEIKNLFIEISNEEAAAVSGGSLLTTAAYITIAKAFNISPDLIKNTALLFLINDSLIPGFLTGSFISAPREDSSLFQYHQTGNSSSLFLSQLIYNKSPWV